MGAEHKHKAGHESSASGGTSHNDEVEHTPIIITDGSAAIEFAEVQHYKHILGTNINRADDLKLSSVQTNLPHDDGSLFCRRFSAGENCVIVATEQGNKNFTITGSADGPEVDIEFDHSVYKRGIFTPKGNGHRFGNMNSKLVRFQIFVDSAPVHDCELISREGIEYTINDPHAFES